MYLEMLKVEYLYVLLLNIVLVGYLNFFNELNFVCCLNLFGELYIGIS